MSANTTTSPSVADLLGRGYFPKELPPVFSTSSYGKFCLGQPTGKLQFDTSGGRVNSKPEFYFLARGGNLRRELAILNPVHYGCLCECIVENWGAVAAKFASNFSLTTPVFSSDGRALERATHLDALPDRRARARKLGGYLLKTDISRFYQSIYTHCIPWAFHSKKTAKVNRSDALFGNKIDRLVRNCQDGQTIGIPVGPDTSLVIAEAVLSQIDKTLVIEGVRGFRYVDDYEISFRSEQEALDARTRLQSLLLEYELNLNPLKTSIRPLPQSMQDTWVAELGAVDIDEFGAARRKGLIRYCDLAFKLAREHPADGVLKYAAGRLAKLSDDDSTADLLVNLLCQIASTEPGCLGMALRPLLKRVKPTAAEVEDERQLFGQIILKHAGQRHTSEVSWAIWAALVLKRELPRDIVEPVLSMGDSVCALLLLHARQLKLVSNDAAFRKLRLDVLGESLYGPRWLLLYEGVKSGWIRFGKGSVLNNPIASDVNFKRLWNGGVSFYDKSKINLPEPEWGAFGWNGGALAQRAALVDEYLSGFRTDYEDASEDEE